MKVSKNKIEKINIKINYKNYIILMNMIKKEIDDGNLTILEGIK